MTIKLRHKTAVKGERIVISGSMSFHSTMLEQARLLTKAGIRAVVPPADSGVIDDLEDEQYQKAKRRLSMQHIRRIRDPKTYALLVVNCDKHGLPDYIGPNTFAEIAIALAHYKPIYLYQGIPQFYRDELTAWKAICLDGCLDVLVRDCKRIAVANAQPTLFDME